MQATIAIIGISVIVQLVFVCRGLHGIAQELRKLREEDEIHRHRAF